MAADTAHQRECAVKVGLVQVIEKNAADAAWFIAMLEKEVLVAPLLVVLIARMAAFAPGGQRIAAGLVEMLAVFVKAVVGREVHATAKPEHRRGIVGCGMRDKAAHIHMHRRRIGIARMQHQRYAHGLERAPGQLRALRAGRRRQLGAAYM